MSGSDEVAGQKDILKVPMKRGGTAASKDAINWFVKRMKKKREKSPSKMDNSLTVGSMYMYRYDPKTKLTMPYYDTAPLVIPIKPYGDGFLGINLHYIAPAIRKKLLVALIDIFGEGTDSERYMKLSYNMLNGISRVKYFQPCVKRYLFSHFTSSFQRIPPDEWANAIMLPTARFVGASTGTVYNDSNSRI